MDDQHFPVDRIPDERLQRAVQIMTTEHFTLQSGRGGTIAEINGIIGGVLVTLLAAWSSTLPLALSVGLGLTVGVLIVAMEVVYGRRVDRHERWHAARFPAPPIP